MGHAVAPSRRPVVQRVKRVAEGLQLNGWRVTVLTMKPPYTRPNDRVEAQPSTFELIRTHAWAPRVLLRDAIRRCRRPTYSAGGTEQPSSSGSVKRSGIIRSFLRPPARKIRSSMERFEFPDEYIGWLPFALAATRKRNFDIVFATIPWATSGIVGHAIARRHGSHFVLDYRDPWYEKMRIRRPHFDDAMLKRHQDRENLLLRDASMVFAMTPTIADWLNARGCAAVEIMTNSFEETEDVQRYASDANPAFPFRVVYAGSLAYGRSLRPIMEAVRSQRDRWPPSRVRIVHAGDGSDATLADARSLEVEEWLEDHGAVDRQTALELIHGATVAVVIVSSDYDYAYPSKLFDAIGKSPVLLLGPPDCDAGKFVERHQLGWAVSPGDQTRIAQVLDAAFCGNVPKPVNLDALKTRNVMGRLDSRLRSLLATHRSPAKQSSNC